MVPYECLALSVGRASALGALALLSSCAAPGAFSALGSAGRRALTGPSLASVREQAEAIDFKGRGGWQRLADDLLSAPLSIWGDVSSLVRSPDNWVVLGGAAALGGVVQNADVDLWRYQERGANESDLLPGGMSRFLDGAGDGWVLFSAASALYGYGLVSENQEHYLAGRTAFASMATSSVLTTALKVLVDAERPNGGRHGYPSGHTALSMALASTLQTSYGWEVGLPLYLLSGLVAFQRMDSGAHDIDDVIVGAAIGYLSARQVHRSRHFEFLGARVMPFMDPSTATTGLSLTWSF
ncbi:MAG: phosphatase PAP2 family protein [Planctomycetota bacterium]